MFRWQAKDNLGFDTKPVVGIILPSLEAAHLPGLFHCPNSNQYFQLYYSATIVNLGIAENARCGVLVNGSEISNHAVVVGRIPDENGVDTVRALQPRDPVSHSRFNLHVAMMAAVMVYHSSRLGLS